MAGAGLTEGETRSSNTPSGSGDGVFSAAKWSDRADVTTGSTTGDGVAARGWIDGSGLGRIVFGMGLRLRVHHHEGTRRAHSRGLKGLGERSMVVGTGVADVALIAILSLTQPLPDFENLPRSVWATGPVLGW